METKRFDEMNLSPGIMRALKKHGYENAMPIQVLAIPPMLELNDVTAKAPTGSGKTFAFGIPIIEQIDVSENSVQALILAPTRELALQICAEMRTLAEFSPGIRMVTVYGGQAIGAQITALKKRPQIVVATPGRLLDHIGRRTIRLDKVRTAVLDEADRMLDMGFIKEVKKILNLVPNRKNLAMFSATMSREVMDIAWIYQRDAAEITVQKEGENKPDIRQYSLEISGSAKIDAMTDIFDREDYEKVIVFCNTKSKTDRLAKILVAKKYPADCIHGDMRQRDREKVMNAFRSGKLRILVATDVAARGIDVDDVDAVFNYDLPPENEYYIHRIGRTGRAKKNGVAYTFVDYTETSRLRNMARYTKSEITPMKFDENKNLIPVNGN